MQTVINKTDILPLLQSYAQELQSFQFDQAKDLIEEFRAKYQCQSGLDGHSSAWLLLMQSLTQLVHAEKDYYALSFLMPKGFLRKQHVVKTNYNAIRTELQKTSQELAARDRSSLSSRAGEGVLSGDEVDTAREQHPVTLVEHLLKQYFSFVSARIDMMNFYEKLATVSSGKALTLAQATEMLEALMHRHTGTFHHPLISPLESACMYEMEIVLGLLRCQWSLSAVALLPSLLHLKEVHSRLRTWLAHANLDNRASSSSSWFGIGGNNPQGHQLALCVWLQKFYDHMISKFSLYFFEMLAKQVPTPDLLKHHFGKVAINFPQKLANFYRKQDASHICLVLNGQGISGFQGIAYQHPDKAKEPMKGLENYPIVFSHPPDKPPLHLLPSIVMILNDHSSKVLLAQRPFVFTYDSQKSLSYYVSFVEGHLYLVLIFPGKKDEKDGVVTNFVTELCSQLRCSHLFSELKLGIKQ